MSFQLSSTAFEQGQTIPKVYTGEGADRSPPLTWTDPPAKTKGLALLCEDPDAPRGTFIHWIVFNLPAESRELSEDIQHQDGFPDGTLQGTTSFGKVGYGGPMPPPGSPHRYYFRLFALDRMLGLPAGVKSEQVYASMQGHILGKAELMGTYAR
jgi:Raf kinase inhibitor-like YbhB/YbcL family protein